MITKTKPRGMSRFQVEKLVKRQKEMSQYVGKRKHCSQITHEEEVMLFDRLKAVEQWGISAHTFDRMDEKGIKATYEDVVSAIHNSTIVEYKIDYFNIGNRCEERIVLRSKAVVNGSYNLKVVLNLGRKDIVTVWMNEIDDYHATLDFSIYDENMKVFGAE